MKQVYLKPLILGLMIANLLPSCFLVVDDGPNSSKFKRNLLKADGIWEVSREDNYYTDNNDQNYLGGESPVVIGTMQFTKEETPIKVAGDMGLWTPKDSASVDIIYQIYTETSIQVSIYTWKNEVMDFDAGYHVLDDYDKYRMTWNGHDNTHLPGDTLVKHTYYFENLGF